MLTDRGKYLRRLCLRSLKAKGGGHMGSAFSLIEIMMALYDDIKKPEDKIILSKGHGALALYAILADKGYFPVEELDRYTKKDGQFGVVCVLGGHPSPNVPGVICHTGSLGHGLSVGVGLALAAKIKKQTHRIFVIVGDGEIQEGSTWEAAMCAAKHKLDNLTVIVDYNKMQSSGEVGNVCPIEPLINKWRAFGFITNECNGHDMHDLRLQLSYKPSSGPNCLVAHTLKGRGVSFAENHNAWHHRAITPEQFAQIEAELS